MADPIGEFEFPERITRDRPHPSEGRPPGQAPGLTRTDIEFEEWRESLDAIIEREGKERAVRVLQDLTAHARRRQVAPEQPLTTPFINTIPREDEPEYPGDLTLETRIENLTRWNAVSLVARANRMEKGLGGHISTYSSIATLYEVGLNHFFRGRDYRPAPDAAPFGDMIYFQGHASPGNYARAFLEGRLREDQLDFFRRELSHPDGLSSYPHAWLMPDFWEFPTVSMGLGPLQAVYRARFERYLQYRGLKEANDSKVWAFVGDGEFDEPETVGALSLASREKLDHLIFVMNCNLQRLDGPVRSGGKIIQEMEGVFRGAGWEVIKVVWGSGWDRILERDTTGELVDRLTELPDVVFQRSRVEGGSYLRKIVFGQSPTLRAMVEDISDDELTALVPGGHDPVKVHAAYARAVQSRGRPVAILAHTVKGFGQGAGGEARNMTHKAKDLTREQARAFRQRFEIPEVSEPRKADAESGTEDAEDFTLIRPAENSPEMRYLHQRRAALGGYLPERRIPRTSDFEPVPGDLFEEISGETKRPVSTTHLMVRALSRLARHESIGKHVVPIVPDEARTFGIDALFSSLKIHAAEEPKYPPVDAGMMISYTESPTGQILEEGITEAGAMSSFIAAGTSHSVHGVPTIPLFFFYSMFGFQRIGDLIWAAGDARARGFLLGCTAGRTSLSGEGLQHQDGQSHLFALAYPHVRAFDPCFGYELAIILEDGLKRMYGGEEGGSDELHYITLTNEDYPHPAMPDDPGVREGILRGLYLFSDAPGPKRKTVDLIGSGSLLRETIRAKEILQERFDIGARVWSATSYKELWCEAEITERHNRLHTGKKRRRPYVLETLENASDTIVAVTDYTKALPATLGRWLGHRLRILGTDGFGRSDGRKQLRRYFEVDAEEIAYTALDSLYQEERITKNTLKEARRQLGVERSP